MSTNFRIEEEWAGWHYNPDKRSDKVWAASYTNSGHVLVVYGRRNERGSYHRWEKQFADLGYASDAFRSKVNKKQTQTDAYRAVNFNDPARGNIPSFRTWTSTTGDISYEIGFTNGEITGGALIKRAQDLLANINLFRGKRFNPSANATAAVTRIIMEYQQLQMLIGVFLSLEQSTELSACAGALDEGALALMTS